MKALIEKNGKPVDRMIESYFGEEVSFLELAEDLYDLVEEVSDRTDNSEYAIYIDGAEAWRGKPSDAKAWCVEN